MGKMFDMDNPVWRFMGKVTDMFFLTCLWLLFSLPVVTIGASTCALCYCSMTLASNKEGYIREMCIRDRSRGRQHDRYDHRSCCYKRFRKQGRSI